MAPVVFEAGALGNAAQVVVSQQHRMLITAARAELLFGEPQVLVPAVYLADQGVGHRRAGGRVRYIHLLFDHHQIVFSAGCPSESFLVSDQAHLPPAIKTELDIIFPNLMARATAGQAARRCLRRYEAAVLAA